MGSQQSEFEPCCTTCCTTTAEPTQQLARPCVSPLIAVSSSNNFVGRARETLRENDSFDTTLLLLCSSLCPPAWRLIHSSFCPELIRHAVCVQLALCLTTNRQTQLMLLLY